MVLKSCVSEKQLSLTCALLTVHDSKPFVKCQKKTKIYVKNFPQQSQIFPRLACGACVFRDSVYEPKRTPKYFEKHSHTYECTLYI